MKHTNKIAKDILNNEFADYHCNSWHYDREYKMIVTAIELSKKDGGYSEKDMDNAYDKGVVDGIKKVK
jgi:hypothetical protein